MYNPDFKKVNQEEDLEDSNVVRLRKLNTRE